jgi:hypothetical protein
LAWTKDKYLRHFDFGAVATAGAFLSCTAKKVSKEGRPDQHEGPSSADNRAAAAVLASLKQASKKPRPLVPRFGVLQGESKKPSAIIAVNNPFNSFEKHIKNKYHMVS